MTGELVIGCLPCDQKVVVQGDYNVLSGFDNDVAQEIGNSNLPPRSCTDEWGGWTDSDGLKLCPERGTPCPYKASIDDLAQRALLVAGVTSLNEPGILGRKGMSYLDPSKPKSRFR